MNEHAAEYQYTFTMPDGEAFGLTVQQQSNGRWFVQAWNEKGEIVFEDHDWNSIRFAVASAIGVIVEPEDTLHAVTR